MNRRRGFFMHRNDASRGESLSKLATRKQYLAIGLYWYVLEICNQRDSSIIELEIDLLAAHYNCRKVTIRNALETLTQYITDVKLSYKKSLASLEISNYAEYQETRAQKRRRKLAESAPIKDKRLNIEDVVQKTATTSVPLLPILKHESSNDSDSHNLEKRFDVEGQKILKWLKTNNFPAGRMPKILDHFGTEAIFNDWAKGFHESPAFLDLKTVVEQRRYFLGALRREYDNV